MMKKKVLALVLALTMALSLLPVTAMADGGGASTTYTVTFNTNGATSGTVPTQITAAAGDTFKVPDAGNPNNSGELFKRGCGFIGWYDGQRTYKRGQTYTMPDGNVTLTAQWISIGIDSFDVLDDKESGKKIINVRYTVTPFTTTDHTLDIWWIIAGNGNSLITTGKGDTIVVPANTTLSNLELTSQFVVDDIEPGKELSNATQLRLHVRDEGSNRNSADRAYCVKSSFQSDFHTGYHVTLDANGGLYNEETTTKLFVDTSAEYGTYGAFEWVDASPSREGYTFKGYARTANAPTPEHADDTLKNVAWAGTEVAKWYAVWTPNQYTVTVDANGGTIATGKDVTSYTYGVGATLPVAADMAKAGYTFGGWYTDSAFGGTAVTEISNTDTGDKTFYAKWTPSQYTVTFNANGGTGTMAGQPFVYDAAAQPLSANTFTKTGYTFLGWAETETGAVKYADKASVSNLATSGNVDLYAVWAPNQVSTLPAQGAKYFVKHYVENWDGSYTLAETEVLSGEIGTTVTADSTKYDDNAHHVNTATSILNGVVTFDLSAADPMSSLLTLKVYYDITPYYGSVDPTPVIPSVDVDIHDDTLSDAAKAVGSAVKSGAADITPVAGYTKESIAQMQKGNALKLVVEKKNSYDPAEKSLIDKAAQEKGKTALVQFLEIDVTLRTMNDVIVAEVDDTIVDLTITVDLNAEMQKAAKEGKTIYVARAHDGKVTFIEGTLNAEKTQFTFDSSKFSTYALVALDGETVTSAKTADPIGLYFGVTALATVGSAWLAKKKED